MASKKKKKKKKKPSLFPKAKRKVRFERRIRSRIKDYVLEPLDAVMDWGWYAPLRFLVGLPLVFVDFFRRLWDRRIRPRGKEFSSVRRAVLESRGYHGFEILLSYPLRLFVRLPLVLLLSGMLRLLHGPKWLKIYFSASSEMNALHEQKGDVGLAALWWQDIANSNVKSDDITKVKAREDIVPLPVIRGYLSKENIIKACPYSNESIVFELAKLKHTFYGNYQTRSLGGINRYRKMMPKHFLARHFSADNAETRALLFDLYFTLDDVFRRYYRACDRTEHIIWRELLFTPKTAAVNLVESAKTYGIQVLLRLLQRRFTSAEADLEIVGEDLEKLTHEMVSLGYTHGGSLNWWHVDFSPQTMQQLENLANELVVCVYRMHRQLGDSPQQAILLVEEDSDEEDDALIEEDARQSNQYAWGTRGRSVSVSSIQPAENLEPEKDNDNICTIL